MYTEGWVFIWIIVGALVIAFGTFVLAVLIRLWDTLGHIRESCKIFNAQSEVLKMRAIQMCKNGINIGVIADKLRVDPRYVKQWCLDILKQRAISYARNGKSHLIISSALGVSIQEVEKWIREIPE